MLFSSENVEWWLVQFDVKQLVEKFGYLKNFIKLIFE